MWESDGRVRGEGCAGRRAPLWHACRTVAESAQTRRPGPDPGTIRRDPGPRPIPSGSSETRVIRPPAIASRPARRGGALWLLAACGTLPLSAAADESCRPGAPRADRLAGLGIRGELILASGRRAVLSDLRWPDDPAADAAARAWLLPFRESPLTLTERGGEDRWGRRRVDAVAEGSEPTDLAGGLITAGLAQADPGEADLLCRPALRALEAAPRAAGRGLWKTGAIGATDAAALNAHAGRYAVAEGRILHVGERSARTYLDFAPRGAQGLTVTVQKRTWRGLAEHGLTAAALKGRLVRVRGTVEMGRGPVIDLTGRDAIEIVEGERALRR